MSAGTYPAIGQVLLLTALFFAYAGDPPPMVNEAHYLVKAKNFWQPTFAANDLFASSPKAHVAFYLVFGWPTQWVSLATTAWIGRFAGWLLLSIGLRRLTHTVTTNWYAPLIVAVIWIAGVEYGNLAGEWVIGGIEAKVPAYGFVLLGLASLVRRKWNQVWIYLGAASAFHVLTGGWSVVAAGMTWWFSERPRDNHHPLLTRWLWIGGAISLAGLIPALTLTMGASDAEVTLAARIYSYYRIKHHLLPADFHLNWYLRHFGMIIVTGMLARFYWSISEPIRQVGWFTIAAIALAITGLVIGLLPPWLPDLAAKLLRYYWFRLTDATVPLLAGLLVAKMVSDSGRGFRFAGAAIWCAAAIAIGASSVRHANLGIPPAVANRWVGLPDVPIAKQRQAYRDWLAVCRWVDRSTPIDEVFLTPRHQQTFKWYGQRAEVVNWKDVPQDAITLKQWHERMRKIYPNRLGNARVTVRYRELREYRTKYGVRFMIVDRRMVGQRLPLIQVYPAGEETNETYAVYELPIVDR